ncbi:AAA family ATPase [Candidatus Shapirobacteria bacterium]|nr:AAA family ATPase [Candidatus Shapirobacteria bacterium]
MPLPPLSFIFEDKPVGNLTLSVEQKKLFHRFENTESHMFITGKAGTGKSVLLQYIKLNTKKKIVVVAPTGVAALNVGGQTIHSLFLLPPSFIDINSLKVSSKNAKILKSIDTLVIDEVSMVRADVMDGIDHVLRKTREDNRPFGGIQLLMFGDLYQLPPVVNEPDLIQYFNDHNGGFYFFNSLAWNGSDLEIYELNTIFRQTDEGFKYILNSLRSGDLSEDHLSVLNQRSVGPAPSIGVITLATTNSTVFQINHSRLNSLPDKSHTFSATVTGDLDAYSFPTESNLELKKGAQIMMLKNDSQKRWVNGSLGIIESVTSQKITVKIGDNVYDVEPETWNKIRYYYSADKHQIQEEVVSSFTQFPIRLAWAVTIHKSQGQTYDSVIIDLGRGAFAHGQTYVALSRCKSLETLYLRRPLTYEDILIDPAIISFMSKANINKL